MGILSLIVIMVIGGAIIYQATSGIRKYKRIPTFQDYKDKHPDSVTPNGVKCSQCGGHQIFVQKAGHMNSTILNLHLCKQCGSTLYRSSTP